jgi:protein ImuA
MLTSKADIISALQQDILLLQGFKPSDAVVPEMHLGPIVSSFPNGVFPLGAVHEFLALKTEDTAVTTAFVAGLLSGLTQGQGIAVWISVKQSIFPPFLEKFGLHQDRVIFVSARNEKEVVGCMEEALKCAGVAAVVAETRDLDFVASRRLQLAVEHSRVTGFILRENPRKVNATACVSRWHISSLPSDQVDNLPGVGFPQWRVELSRVRNGQPGIWTVKWVDGQFAPVIEQQEMVAVHTRKAG